MCYGIFTVFLYNSHFLAIGGVTADRRVDSAMVGLHMPIYNRLIFSRESVPFDLFGEGKMCKIILCNDQKSACILIDAVNNAGANDAVDAGQRTLAVI